MDLFRRQIAKICTRRKKKGIRYVLVKVHVAKYLAIQLGNKHYIQDDNFFLYNFSLSIFYDIK